MTFVAGPEQASFLDEKPAKLRFFIGYVDEFTPGDDSDRVSANCHWHIARGVETRVTRPLRISPPCLVGFSIGRFIQGKSPSYVTDTPERVTISFVRPPPHHKPGPARRTYSKVEPPRQEYPNICSPLPAPLPADIQSFFVQCRDLCPWASPGTANYNLPLFVVIH